MVASYEKDLNLDYNLIQTMNNQNMLLLYSFLGLYIYLKNQTYNLFVCLFQEGPKCNVSLCSQFESGFSDP